MNEIAVKKLKDYENNLIETDRRNNLINLKDNLKTFKIIYPSIDKIYSLLIQEKKCNIKTIEQVISTYSKEFENTEESDRKLELSTEKLIERIEKDGNINDLVYDEFNLSKILKDDEFIIYNKKSKIDIDKDTTIKKLDDLLKDSTTYMKERGIHVLYASLGSIKWHESSSSDSINNSPLALVQIQIKRENKGKPFKIELRESDLEVNPFLNYKFHQDFGIRISSYENQSIKEYLETIKADVASLSESYGIKYEIKEDVFISNFRTDKISMYLDIKNNRDFILKNKNVLRILGESKDDSYGGDKEDMDYKNFNPIMDLHSVVDADSSQIEAILAAKRNESFVLQGPPGTGKSQTITNIIAESLYDGKKVLFVSQKQAALEVVKNNLDKVGFSDFYLDLFDKVTNKEVLMDINALLDKNIRKNRKSSADNSQEIKLQDKLDTYSNLLHEIDSDTKKSLYDYYGQYYLFKDYMDIDYIIPIPKEGKKEFLDRSIELINSYKAYSKELEYDYKKVSWYGYKLEDNSLQTQSNLKQNLNESIEIYKDLISIRQRLDSEFGINIDSFDDLVNFKNIVNYLNSNNIIIKLDAKNLNEDKKKSIGELKDLGLKIRSLKNDIDLEYKEGIYDIDIDDLHFKLTQVFSSKLKRITSRGEYKRLLYQISKNSRGRGIDYNQALEILENIITYKDMVKKYSKLETNNYDLLGPDYKGLETDWNDLNESWGIVGYINEDPGRYTLIKDLSLDDLISDVREDGDLLKSINKISEYKDTLDIVQGYFEENIINIFNAKIDEVLLKFELMVNKFSKINNWIYFRNLINDLEDYNILTFIDNIIAENIPLKNIDKIYLKRFYFQLIEDTINQYPILSGFNKNIWDRNVNKFKELDKDSFDKNQDLIRHKLYKNLPSKTKVSANSKYTFLRKEGQKKRKIRTIREILSEAGKEILNIKPCFLVSPLNVSSYLDPEKIEFDLVIFDEASQIFPWEAMGSIYRAKQTIIVGDTKQMPPSDYFRSSVDTDFDDNLSEVNDYESILDICSGYFSQVRLHWHYRSKYEELIAFSNKNFYNGNLLTFPSSNPSKSGEGLEFYHIDSKLDSISKKNINEAEYVVDLIYDHFRNYPNRSLGVISLNTKQGELIEKLLENKRALDSSFEDYFSEDRKEPFFLKNLETVQGDERDTIIFSIGFAKNENGIINRNFGPLSRQGGERRLNVAASRAKINMKVISSIHSYDLKVEDLKNEGASYLRDYLDYAENGAKALDRSLNVDENDHFDSSFEEEVCNYLRDNGMTVDTQIGVSGYKIDMGLRLENTSKYLLAIECDGRTYHSSKNARDRDILRQEILENLGWKFYRIWSTDWYRNNEKAKEDILSACKKELRKYKSLNNIEDGSEKIPNPSSDEDKLDQSELEMLKDVDFLKKYEVIDIYDKTEINKIDISNRDDLNKLIDSILYQKSPIKTEDLYNEINSILETDISQYSLAYIFSSYIDKRGPDVYTKKDEIFISDDKE